MPVWSRSRPITPVVNPLETNRGGDTDSFSGVILPPATLAVVTAAAASCAVVILPTAKAAPGIVGAGRVCRPPGH